jgi:hypothetical protein
MLTAGSVGLILGLVAGVMRGDQFLIQFLVLAWFAAPLWGSIALAFLKPAVTRWLFRACCLVVLPVSGCCLFLSALVEETLGFVSLSFGLGILWIIVPFGFGDILSKHFHAGSAQDRGNDGSR